MHPKIRLTDIAYRREQIRTDYVPPELVVNGEGPVLIIPPSVLAPVRQTGVPVGEIKPVGQLQRVKTSLVAERSRRNHGTMWWCRIHLLYGTVRFLLSDTPAYLFFQAHTLIFHKANCDKSY